jgi:hypothetical protein
VSRLASRRCHYRFLAGCDGVPNEHSSTAAAHAANFWFRLAANVVLSQERAWSQE